MYISTARLKMYVFHSVVIAQCLEAAQKTVPDGFSVHSMTCYFLLAGDNQIPLEYSVQRVRDGKSFVTRTVVANQNDNSICTSTLSFSRRGQRGKNPYAMLLLPLQGFFHLLTSMWTRCVSLWEPLRPALLASRGKRGVLNTNVSASGYALRLKS